VFYLIHPISGWGLTVMKGGHLPTTFTDGNCPLSLGTMVKKMQDIIGTAARSFGWWQTEKNWRIGPGRCVR
jgi:hypothetical protein